MAGISDTYCKQWKEPLDHSKGTVWTYMTRDAYRFIRVLRSTADV